MVSISPLKAANPSDLTIKTKKREYKTLGAI